jgi:hypothetical protein
MAMKLTDLEIKTKLPTIPKSMPIFSLAAPSFEDRKAAIGRLAEVMKLGTLRTVELEHARILSSERGDIHYFHASGAIWARDATATEGTTDEMRNWDGLIDTKTDGQRMLLNPEASRRLIAQADEMLRPVGLLGKDVGSQTVQLDQVAHLDAKGKEIAYGAGQATIKFQYAIDAISVRGAGAKTLVFAEPGRMTPGTAGSPARISGVFHAWRPIGDKTALAMSTLEEALGVGLLADPELEDFKMGGHRIQITRLELVYLALPAFMRQAYLFPAFQIEGVVSEGQKGISFHFGRFHHAAPPRAYAAVNAHGPSLMMNPDGISAKHTKPVLV